MHKSVVVRASLHINRKVTQNGFRAFDYAADIGQSLGLYVVIHLRETLGVSAETIFRRVRHKFCDWCAYKRKTTGLPLRPTYVATFENPSLDRPHVNWPLHLPAALHAEFCKKLPLWIERAQGAPTRRFDVHVSVIRAGTEKRVAKYCFKGADPDYLDHFFLRELHEKHGQQGPIYGRRAIVSRALGPSSRAASGWKPRRRRKPPASA